MPHFYKETGERLEEERRLFYDYSNLIRRTVIQTVGEEKS